MRTLVETTVLVGERGRYRPTHKVQAIQIAPTVQAMLAARIARLSQESKRLLQAASVVGTHVPFALLQAIAELPDKSLRKGLVTLQAAEFLNETGLYPDLEYSFKHSVTHDVTYGGLLQETRRDLHARIVDAIETLHRDRLGEQIERLAHHALRGELHEKAVPYLRQAGLKATARSALAAARVWFEEALEILAALPESPSTLEQGFEIRLELGTVLVRLAEPRRRLEHMHEAETLAERLNDDRRRGRVCVALTNTYSLLGELDEALVTGARALEIAARLGDLRLRIRATTYFAQAHQFRGDFERAGELATDSLAMLPADWACESLGDSPIPISVWCRLRVLHSLAELGRFAEAAPHEAELLRLAGPTQHAFTVAEAHNAAGMLHLRRGDWATARSEFEISIAAYRTGNIAVVLPGMVAASAWASRRSARRARRCPGSGRASSSSSDKRCQEPIPTLTTRWVVPRYCSTGSMRRRVWATVR